MAFLVSASALLLCFMFYCSPAFSNPASDTIQQELLARIDALEVQGYEQAKILISQTAKIAQQQQTIDHYQDRVNVLERRVDELEAESYTSMDEPEERHDIVKELGELNAKQQHVSKKVDKGNQLKQHRHVDNDTQVAFHAIIKAYGQVTDLKVNRSIVFRDVLVNLGNGYNNVHGIFLAPTPGIYMFSTSILSYDPVHTEVYVHLMKDETILANAYAHGDSQGSVTVVTQLDKGDSVWVSLYGPKDGSLWGDSFDSFSGCLIFPM